MILLHPAHRKIIRLLRQEVNIGRPIVIMDTDLVDFEKIIGGTKNALIRHKRIYRLLLRVIYRPYDESLGYDRVLDADLVNYIEKIFCTLEWRSPFRTFLNVLFTYVRKYLFTIQDNKKYP